MKAPTSPLIHRLKVAAGQLHGVADMIEDERSFVDVYNQLRAVEASLTQAQISLLTAELGGDRERAKLLQKALELAV